MTDRRIFTVVTHVVNTGEWIVDGEETDQWFKEGRVWDEEPCEFENDSPDIQSMIGDTEFELEDIIKAGVAELFHRRQEASLHD